MWRFFETVNRPEKRQKLNETERKEKNAVYDKEKRTRRFLVSWKTDRKWLEFDENENCMFCVWCREFSDTADKSNFVVGCKNFKLESVTSHGSSEQHTKSHLKKSAQLRSPDDSSAANKILETLNKHIFNRLVYMFNNVHALIKNRRPFTDFIWMCTLDDKKGLDIGETYRNDKQVVTFGHFIAEVERQSFVKYVNGSKFLSIICDGCTDTAVMEEEIVYVRVCYNGDITSSFLAIGSPERADANGILKLITDSLNESGILDWQSKLVAFASDGANVMMGKNAGVVAKLKEIQPSLQGVHCFAHRLELAYKDVIKGTPYYNKMYSLLSGIFTFYHTSHLHRSNLKAAIEAKGGNGVMPTRIGGTRWLSHTEKALENFWRTYGAIKTHMEQIQRLGGATVETMAKSLGYLKLMKDPTLIKLSLFMTDIISVLSILSLMFQDSQATVSDIKKKLDATISILEKYKTRDGPRLRQIETFSADSGIDIQAGNLTEKQRFDLCDKIIKCLQTRFSDTSDGIIAACKIASFRNWPLSYSDACDFGDDEVGLLVNHFKPILINASVNTDAVELEWYLLKETIYNRYKDILKLKWDVVSKSCANGCENILSLIDLILTIPAHSADAERGFSEMKLVKSDWRSKLRPSVLSDLLFILFHTQDIKSFDPTPAINLWHTSGKRARRPEQSPYGPRDTSVEDVDNDNPFKELDPDFMC